VPAHSKVQGVMQLVAVYMLAQPQDCVMVEILRQAGWAQLYTGQDGPGVVKVTHVSVPVGGGVVEVGLGELYEGGEELVGSVATTVLG